VEVIAADPLAATVYFQDWRHLAGERRDEALRQRNAYEALWREMVADGIRRGEIREQPVELAAIAWLSAGNWVHQWFKPTGRMTAEEIAAQLAGTLLEGMRAAPTRERTSKE
jgi:hypothetical protein